VFEALDVVLICEVDILLRRRVVELSDVWGTAASTSISDPLAPPPKAALRLACLLLSDSIMYFFCLRIDGV